MIQVSCLFLGKSFVLLHIVYYLLFAYAQWIEMAKYVHIILYRL